MKNKPLVSFSMLKKEKPFRIILTAFVLFTFLSVHAQQPLVAYAGNDSIFCEHIDSFLIGGFPSVEGGLSPDTYTWDIYPKPYIPFPSAPQIHHYCSDFLNDTTVANPTLLMVPNENFITFILTVSDSSGQTAIDSVTYREIQWVMALGNTVIETFPGDTQTITATPFGGGIYPYTYDWGNSPDLIGAQFDYNVYATSPEPNRQVIIPNNPSPSVLFYDILVTDSAGCPVTVSSFQGFLINPSSTQSFTKSEIEVFPNPVVDQLFIKANGQRIAKLELTDSNGKLIDISGRLSNTGQTQMDFSKLSSGTYNIQIEIEDQKFTKKILKIDR